MAGSVKHYPSTIEGRLEELTEARVSLMDELKDSLGMSIPSNKSDGWSAAEIAYHLYLTEKQITKMLNRALGSDQRQEAMIDEKLCAEWEKIIARVGNRELRIKAPNGVIPTDAPELTKSIELLKESREELLGMIKNTTIEKLASISIPHPLEAIGLLTGLGWLTLIAQHEHRHTKQIQVLKKEVSVSD